MPSDALTGAALIVAGAVIGSVTSVWTEHLRGRREDRRAETTRRNARMDEDERLVREQQAAMESREAAHASEVSEKRLRVARRFWTAATAAVTDLSAGAVSCDIQDLSLAAEDVQLVFVDVTAASTAAWSTMLQIREAIDVALDAGAKYPVRTFAADDTESITTYVGELEQAQAIAAADLTEKARKSLLDFRKEVYAETGEFVGV